MIRRTLGIAFVSALTTPAVAEQESGFAFGARTGYALPMGEEQGTVSGPPGSRDAGLAIDLPDDLSGMIPLWLDVGYRIHPNFYVGAFFQYGVGFLNKDHHAACSQVDCSARDIRFGANLHYHISPAASFDPWLGAGIGYEILTIKNSLFGQSAETSRTLKGFEFLDLQVGGDFRVSEHFVLGPFVSFSIGEYTSWSMTTTAAGVTTTESGDLKNTGPHEWLTIGLRGQFNL